MIGVTGVIIITIFAVVFIIAFCAKETIKYLIRKKENRSKDKYITLDDKMYYT